MPKLALCNFIPDIPELKSLASGHGFDGIDWSFDINELPQTPTDETRWARDMARLSPLEVRYHCPFQKVDLGHEDQQEAKRANDIFRRVIRLVSRAEGRYLTIHIGLGHESTEPLSWDATITNMRDIVQYGACHGVRICLENLAWGWTSRPDLFEKLIRKSGAAVTFDIGHAHACESVRSRQFVEEDFVTPHHGNILNAHIYHTEVPGHGHVTPEGLDDIESRLHILSECGCSWWVIEIRELDALIRTKALIDTYPAIRYPSMERLHENGFRSVTPCRNG